MDASEVISQLDSGLRKRLTFGDAVSFKTQPLPSLRLTKALNGGLPYGRQVLIYGSKSSAKSSLCLELVGMAQKEGKVCAWIDAEMSYDTRWAEQLGVDTSQLIVSEARTINDMVNVATGLMTAGADVIVVDSISSLLPAVYFEKKSDDLKALEDTKQIGAEARDFAHAVKMLNYANNRTKPTLLVLISQTRNNLGMYTSQIPTGGQAVKFYSSIIIKLWSSESEANAISVKRPLGNKIVSENVGREINWLVQFSKTSPAFVSGKYDFYYKENVGVDRAGELFDYAVETGIIEKSGTWFQIFDKQKQGRAASVEYIKNNPEVGEQLEQALSSL